MINNLLTLSCIIEKKSGNTFDSNRNPTITWSTVGTNVSCYIYYQNPTSRLDIGMSGLSEKNVHIGFFRSDQEIGDGYKITCSLFPNSFFVRSSNLIFNPKSKTSSHKECILDVEAT